MLTYHFVLAGVEPSPFLRAQAIDCTSLGMIIAGAACIRTIERYEIRHSRPPQSMSLLLWTFAGSAAALAICFVALVLGATYWTIVASVCGLAAVVVMWIVRRFGPWGSAAIPLPALGVVIFMMAYHSPLQGASELLTFAGSSAPPTAQSQRMLEDAPLLGTGAGTFAALAPIYREIDEPPPSAVAATTLAIELGKPMFWLITAAAIASILFLLRASQRRGRDSYYPAMGGGCLVTTFLIAFANAGSLGPAFQLIFAVTLGVAVSQSKSRTALS